MGARARAVVGCMLCLSLLTSAGCRGRDAATTDERAPAPVISPRAKAKKAKAAKPSATTKISVGPVDYDDPASVQARFDALLGYTGSKRLSGAPAPGSAKGRNVIMIQWEALSAWPVGTKVLGEAVTPNLDKLVATSWYAPRVVMGMGGGTTSDAEFTVNTSLLANPKSAASEQWGDKKLPSLPRLARKAGYEALTFHTNEISYWRRDLLYPALGFSRWYARPDFDGPGDIEGYGPPDNVLYGKVADVLEAKHSERQPFVAEIVTLTSHNKFFSGSDLSDLQVPAGLRDKRLGAYLRAVHAADDELGGFIEQLKRDGIWDDSVVMIYGDHFGVRPWGIDTVPLTQGETDAIPGILGREPTVADTFEVPLVVHLPRQTEPRRIDAVRGQVDIMPTVAELLGLDLSKTPHIGASIFDDRPRTIALRYHTVDGAYTNDEIVYRPARPRPRVLSLADSTTAAATSARKAVYKRVHTLCGVSREYLRSLPSRD